MVRTATTMALLGALCTFAARDALTQDKGQDKRFVIAAPGIPPVFASAILYVADKRDVQKYASMSRFARLRPARRHRARWSPATRSYRRRRR